jgi:hypothetical protein
VTESTDYGIGLGIELVHEVTTTETVGGIDVDLRVVLRGGRYVVHGLSAYPTVDNLDVGVTGEALREVAVGERVERAARDRDAENTIKTTGRRIIGEAGGLTPESLEVVATAYRYGHAVGTSPTREVVNLLGLTRSKASRWIAEAREDGFLGETSERRAGGALLAVEAARDRVAMLHQELAEAEAQMRYQRDEWERAQREADDPMKAMAFDARRLADDARARLDHMYQRLARLQVERDQAEHELARLQHEQEG